MLILMCDRKSNKRGETQKSHQKKLFYHLPVIKQFWICHYLNRCQRRLLCWSSSWKIKFHGRMVQHLVMYSTFDILLRNLTQGFQNNGKRLVLRNQRFLVRVWLQAMCRGELSDVIAWLMSKCMWSEWKW